MVKNLNQLAALNLGYAVVVEVGVKGANQKNWETGCLKEDYRKLSYIWAAILHGISLL